MAVDIHCRIVGTVLFWNGSDWVLLRFDVRLYEDWDVHCHCSATVRSRVTVNIRITEHCRVTVTNMSLSR